MRRVSEWKEMSRYEKFRGNQNWCALCLGRTAWTGKSQKAESCAARAQCWNLSCAHSLGILNAGQTHLTGWLWPGDFTFQQWWWPAGFSVAVGLWCGLHWDALLSQPKPSAGCRCSMLAGSPLRGTFSSYLFWGLLTGWGLFQDQLCVYGGV